MNKFSGMTTVLNFMLFFFATSCFSEIDNLNQIEPIYLENGKPFHYPIWAIDQDSRGFMWFGTMNGLARYNGYEIKMYSCDPGDPNSISGDIVNAIDEDQNGHLWVGTNNGLNEFIPASENFIHYRHDPKESLTLGGNNVKSILFDSRQILWIGTEGGGLNRFHRETGTFTRHIFGQDQPDAPSHNAVHVITEDRYGNLWIGTDGGVYMLPQENLETEPFRFLHFQHDPDEPNSLSDNYITAILADDNNTVWIGTQFVGLNKVIFNSANKFDSYQVQRFQYSKQDSAGLNHNNISAIWKDEQGAIWVGTFLGGLNIYDRQRGNFKNVQPDLFAEYDRFQYAIMCNYKDLEGTLWLGTANKGIVYRQQTSKGFINHPLQVKNLSQVKYVSIHKIVPAQDGGLWLGTNGFGLCYYDRKKDKLTYFIQDTPLEAGIVFGINENIAGQFVCGTFGAGVLIFDPQTGKFRPHPINLVDDGKHSKDRIIEIYPDRFGYLWIGTWGNGLKQFNLNWELQAHYIHDESDSTSIGANIIVVFYEDRFDNLWISTFGGGLLRANADQRKQQKPGAPLYFKRYQVDPDNSTSISSNTVTFIREDSRGYLWVGTEGGGINRFDYNTGHFKRYTSAHGLIDDRVIGMEEDQYGHFWISTLNGLSRFDPEKEKFYNYDISDGILSNEFNRTAIHQTPDGELFFGHFTGFMSFYPENIKHNEMPPPVTLTGFNLFGVPAKFDSAISAKKVITLNYTQKMFSFQFAALNYINTHKNQYACKLEGFHDDWIYTGTERHAHFTNLNPGEYTFKVKAANNDGAWNEQGASVRLIILPPWWRSNWAYTLYIFIGLGVLLTGWQLQVRRIRIRNELNMRRFESQKLREIDSMKSRFFANISHEFRTPLTLILGPLEQMLHNKYSGDLKRQYQLMLQNGKRLLQLINQLLDISTLEAGHVTLQVTKENIVTALREITSSFTSLAEQKKIEFILEAPSDPIFIYIDRDKLEKIICNLLLNALKFTHTGGKITITISETDNTTTLSPGSVKISVADTGIGIPLDKLDKIFNRFYQVDDSAKRQFEGSGIGLALTKELVELHRGKITVESAPGLGTVFTVFLPFEKAAYNPNEIREIASETTAPGEAKTDIQTWRPESAPASETHSPQKVDKSKPILLIVEDNQDVIEYIRRSFDAHYRITEAKDGYEGLDVATKTIPDLIISDVMMPNMDGIQFCEKVKTDDRTSHIPVILLTARAGEVSKIEGLETGADDYIIKPFSIHELSIRAKNLIEQRKKLREYFSQHAIKIHEPEEMIKRSVDRQFLERIISIVEQNLSDSGFGTRNLAHKIGLSRSQLYRKLYAITNHAPNEFIRLLRLRRAEQLLRNKTGNITEIAYEVGFNHISYFAKCFQQTFGYTPSEYIHRKN